MRSSANRPSSKNSVAQLRTLLSRLIARDRDGSDAKRGRLLLESLEARQLLAGDVELMATEVDQASDVADPQPSAFSETLPSSRVAEGEPAPDLVQFAKDLASAGVQFFGAHWCPACTQQKELFADGKDNLPFIEVTDSQRNLNSIGVSEGIARFPTWVFPDDSREEGVLSLETLSQRSGVAIPQSEQPTFEPIGNLTVQVGSPLHIPIDAYDPNGGPLTVTVSVDNPNVLDASVLSGNRSIRIDMQGYGDMVFELFEQRAPRPAGRVIELAQDDFYDGIIFHRIVDNFVIQGGDPTGTGTSGSPLGNFDDQFHPELQHNRSGVLSFAKSSDDTNNSQFFITEVPTRFLDGNHSIFGQLVEGEDVREAISFTATPESIGTGGSQKPINDIVIDSIDVFSDTENSVVMLRSSTVGSTNMTVTVTDQDGNSHSETFSVDVVNDNSNTQPWLGDIVQPAPVPRDTPATLQLTSVDVENDAVTFFAQSSSSDATVSVNDVTGLVTVTPDSGFVGTVNVQVGVRPGPGVLGNSFSDSDTQNVTFTFTSDSSAPTGLDLLTGSDTGSSNIDNITSAGSLTFNVTGVSNGATVELVLVQTGSVVGVGTAVGDTATITTNNFSTLGDGTYQVAARQRDGGQTSSLSAPITLVYDTTSPDSVIATASTTANVGREYRSDLISPEEGSGLRYEFTAAPTGATIDPNTGVITWTPLRAQEGSNTFTLELTDAAGNTRSESFNVDVAAAPLAEIKLELTDAAGNPISSVGVGDEFLMRFIGVDARPFFNERDGVFGAFADVFFDSSLIRPVPGVPIDFAPMFPTLNRGTFLDGQIDELGGVNATLAATNLEESLIATVRFEALAPGTVNIRTDPADLPDSEVLLYGNDDQVPAEAVFYGSATLAIGQNFTVRDDILIVSEDSGATTVEVLNNDEVVSGSETLSVISVTQPSEGGTVSLDNGTVSFTPEADFNGQLTFTYRVSDTNGIQEDATVTVTVAEVNDPPTGVGDTFNVDSDSTNNSLDVLSNDLTDPDTGEILFVVNETLTTSQGGTAVVASDGQSINYTPPSGFTGTDTFTYTVSDGELEDQVQVNVTVAPADDPPTAVNDSFTGLTEDDNEAEFDVLANDQTDGDGQSFVISSVGIPSQGGTARVSTDGTQFFYQPAPDFNGTEEVTYTIRDTGGGLSVGTATFTVDAVNDPPPAVDETIQLNRGTGETLALEISDLPVNVDDGETLTFTNLGTPSAGGSVRFDDDTNPQQIFYTPATTDFSGTETFTYDVTDGSGLVTSGTVTVEVLEFTQRSIQLNIPQSRFASQISGISLKGTNVLGASVNEPLFFSVDSFSIDNVLPGDYTIEIPAIPFLQNAETARSIPVNSGVNDGDMTVSADLGRLRPEFISIRDFIGSAPVKSILIAVDPDGEEAFSSPTSETTEISEPVAQLDATRENLIIRGNDGNGTELSATLATNNNPRVQMRAQVNGFQLLRVDVADLSFDPVTDPLTSNVQPEGESIDSFSQETPQPSGVSVEEQASSSLTFGDRQAEGESIASQSVTVADMFVPVSNQADSRIDATVLPLEEGDVWLAETMLADEVSSPLVGTSSVDAAMSDVSSELTIESSEEGRIAGESSFDGGLDETAIDAVLTSQM